MSVMQMSTTVRLVVYCRVSTLDKGQDVENQLRELGQFVAHKPPRVGTSLMSSSTRRAASPPIALSSSGYSGTLQSGGLTSRCSGPWTDSAVRASSRPSSILND